MPDPKTNHTLNTRVIIKNDTSAQWLENDNVLLKGEIGIEITSGGAPKFKVGNGVSTFSELGYATLTPAEIQSLITSASGHSNKDVLDAIEVALTTALKSNYDAAYTHSQSAHAPANAEENVIDSISVNGQELTPVNKGVDITIDNSNYTVGVTKDAQSGKVSVDLTNTEDSTQSTSFGVVSGSNNVTIDKNGSDLEISVDPYDDTALSASVSQNTSDISTLQTNVSTIQGDLTTLKGTGAGSISKAISDAIDDVEAEIGDLDNLTTTQKSDIVSAVNELKTSVDNTAVAGAVTVTESGTPDTGMSKTYVISQNGSTVGTINVPKDLVVQSGQVVVDPTGLASGTYIELTIANAANDKLYINVSDLVDIYTAEQNATQIQLAVSNAGVISATVVAGSITATELASDAITTAKIADGNVTYDKLAVSVKSSLGKADSSVQSVSINGTEITKDANNGVDITSIPVSLLNVPSNTTLIIDGGSASDM